MNRSLELSITKISIGADKQGYDWKQVLMLTEIIGTHFVEWLDVGTYKEILDVDYHKLINKLINLMQIGDIYRAVLIVHDAQSAYKAVNDHLGAHDSDIKAVVIGVKNDPTEIILKTRENNFNFLIIPAAELELEQDLHNIVNAWFFGTFD